MRPGSFPSHDRVNCRFGRLEETFCRRLEKQGQAFDAIHPDPERLEATGERLAWSYHVGDAMSDDFLRQAATLTSLFPTDFGHASVVLSARTLVPDLRITACILRPEAYKQRQG